MSGKHIELFLVDGEPGGITTANVSGWTGHILSGPRAALTRILARDEAHRNGIYLLLGDDPGAIESVACYIGKTEDFSARFRQHDRQKDWWNRAVLISSRDDSFNEGHWGYLEARLIEVAATAKRCTLPDNAQTPQPRKLSEAQQSDAEVFLEQIRGILSVLGVNILRGTHRTPEQQAPPPDIDSPIFTLTAPKRGVKARGRVVGDEFIMLEGSRVVGEWTNAGRTSSTRRSYESLRTQHAKLVDDGSIAVEGTIGTLTRDIPFPSPSTAGSIAVGYSCNGRIAWKWTGGTYGDWENRDLPTVSTSPDETLQP
ncbi:GIY-YIG nuclease family protein [Actinomyces oris]|uniref:GIY-YIG nuclease family protein n=1 Tax=Actinomyces oris TaxID=544580 RepID=UPI00094C8760|nr:GIY-YIG nuclease family protein [Actinomyces oris]OLO54540.1 methionine sulfoxide reductase [Actinomyces oris]OLO59161.1 methionine sulfoxide reductase [Actinomyces oris]